MSEEVIMPKSWSNIYDIKASYVYNLDYALNLVKNGEIQGCSLGEKNKIIVLTSFGYVTGEIVNLDENNPNDIEDVFTKQLYKSSANRRFLEMVEAEKKEQPLDVINKTCSILMKDVTIKPFNQPNNSPELNMPYLVLFADQICGLSFGTSHKPE